MDDESPQVRFATGPALVGLAAAAFVIFWSVVSITGWERGHIHQGYVELWANDVGNPWTWTGYLHPPLSSLYLYGVDAAAKALGSGPGLEVYKHAAALHVFELGLVALWVLRLAGPWPAAAAAWSMALLPSALRPFEHYPLAAITLVLAVVLLERAAATGTKAAWVAAAAGAFVAIEVHLLAGFALVPAFVAQRPWRKGSWPLWVAAALALLLLWTAWPEAFRILAEGPGHRERRGSPSSEWTPVTLVLCAAFATPRLLRPGPGAGWVAAAFGLGLSVLLLQALQLADGQPWPASLCYFRLVDPLLVGAGGLAISRVSARSPGFGVAAGAALVGGTALSWVRGVELLWTDRDALLILAAPWSWW